MDAVEFAVPAIVAALVLVIGPLLAVLYFVCSRHWLAAGLCGGLWVLGAFSCIRDFRRRHLGWGSVTLGIIWLLATVVIWWRIETI